MNWIATPLLLILLHMAPHLIGAGLSIHQHGLHVQPASRPIERRNP